MNVLAVNGSPRKKWNTATLLEKALAGAASKGATTELVHLYDLDFKGCRSCFECKRIGGKYYGRCAVKDGLTSLLDKAFEADALVLGTPIYFGAETGEFRSFMERLAYPFATYTPGYTSIFPRKIRTALLYTMNVQEPDIQKYHYDKGINRMRITLARLFGRCELFFATDTYQFTDYSKYLTTVWDAAAKAKRREDVFPQDCARAFALGERLTASLP